MMLSTRNAISVVDDEKDIVSVISRSIEKNSSIKVHGFHNPVVALEHIRTGCNDCWLLLSDVRMAEMSGFELVKKVKLLHPEMVILLMTAYEIRKQDLDVALPSTKIDGFIQKPAKMSLLIDEIKRYEMMR